MNNRIKVLVFKTNLESEQEVQAVRSILDEHPQILRWNVDQWDIDNVLRIEAWGEPSSTGFMEMIRREGFLCDELPD